MQTSSRCPLLLPEGGSSRHDGQGDISREGHHWIAVPIAVPSAHILGVAHSLSTAWKWLFAATNVGYYASAAAIFLNQPLPSAATASYYECVRSLCASGTAIGLMVGLLGAVSTVWHWAQVQLPCGCCAAVGEEPTKASTMFYGVRCLQRLVKADVACSAFMVVVGLTCMGPARTFSWLALPLAFFVCGAVAKARCAFRTYAVLHGIWHLLSAAAIMEIALNESPALDSLAGGWRLRRS